ncbi:hypothetical protein FACS1894156_1600 [Bacteroidia bacterium]|nr:hypothetical protein FACS1894156_1600 [Bacteroidia bacterium]
MGNNKLEKVNSVLAVEYRDFLQEILTKIQSARYAMLLSVSKKTLLLYWDIGKAVSKKMQSGGWGQSVVEQLSKDLQTECPGVRGFSARNIWRMKKFYEFYAEILISATVGAELLTNTKSICYNSADVTAELQIAEIANSADATAEILPHIVSEVAWEQNCIIIEKCKDLQRIYFYLRMTKEKGWSRLDLLEKINSNYFENHSLTQNNFEQTIPESLKAQVAFNKYHDLPAEYAKYLPSEAEIIKRLTNFAD